MILIADSGSTKTDWHFVDSKRNIHHFSTIGFNPYFQDSTSIARELQENLWPKLKNLAAEEYSEHLHIYFYGAGCSSLSKNEIVSTGISKVFPKAKIQVEHDLLAAARAVLGSEKGIAAILGTGSNSCYYNGTEISESMPSLGFILGDEGSGAWIGKTFLRDYLYNETPKNISDAFYERYSLNIEQILDAVYTKPLPNKFLASFSQFLCYHKNEDYVKNLVGSAFEDFFKRHICKYESHKQVKMGSVGSVAFNFSECLKEVAAKNGVTLDKIIETPISDLTNYHLLNLEN